MPHLSGGASTDFIQGGGNTDFDSGGSWPALAWTGAYTDETVEDPLFKNEAGHDFSIKSNSPAIDAATLLDLHVAGWESMSGAVKIFGSGLDKGAYEKTKFNWR